MSDMGLLLDKVIAADAAARNVERTEVRRTIEMYLHEVIPAHGNVPADPREAMKQACRELLAALPEPEGPKP